MAQKPANNHLQPLYHLLKAYLLSKFVNFKKVNRDPEKVPKRDEDSEACDSMRQ